MGYHDIYDIHEWDLYGWPGNYVYGDDVYVDDCYMDERWFPVKGFDDYWVSDMGRVWSTTSKKFMYGTPIGKCGHLDLSLKHKGVRYHRFLHRLVAEAFLPNPYNYPIVRHLDDNPANNCVDNLAWGTPYDNVHDCISNGNFRYFTREDIEAANQKRRTPVIAVKLSTGQNFEFVSQQEAARRLGVSQTSISDVLQGKNTNVKGYYFYPSDKELDINVNEYKYSRHRALLRAVDTYTGEEFIFRGQTEAARELGLSISSVSQVLSGKIKTAKGYIFEYVDEEGYQYD